MCHTGITTLSRYYDTNRGKAIAFGSFGFPFGEMIFPLVAVFLINIFSWRHTWLFAGLSIIIFFIPLIFSLLSNHSKRHSDFLKKSINNDQQKNWKVISASQNIQTISNQIKETLLNNFSNNKK